MRFNSITMRSIQLHRKLLQAKETAILEIISYCGYTQDEAKKHIKIMGKVFELGVTILLDDEEICWINVRQEGYRFYVDTVWKD